MMGHATPRNQWKYRWGAWKTEGSQRQPAKAEANENGSCGFYRVGNRQQATTDEDSRLRTLMRAIVIC
jgi:hypothetical protein